MRVALMVVGALCVSWLATSKFSRAEAPRLLSAGERPDDQRLEPPKDLDGYFPFEPSATAEDWDSRAERRRRALLVALGLWPMPTALPANAVVHGRMDMGDYTIEKVYLQSLPDFYVTGNLYRPKRIEGKHPAVLCPHGHFADGRFGDFGRDEVRRRIVEGAERFEEGGRNSIQARCVQLARMGCIVFQYDMVGYCDSGQISYELAHRFAKQRPDMIGTSSWGFYSPQAESHLQSIMGLQTYNSIRALDWVSSLPDVDPERIAVTGASGGGTQTFILCAIDPRPAVSVPAVMVSTAMQGGCTCENATLLRLNTGNVEFAALFAPKPQCLISADDWTREMPAKGYPELRQHYELLSAADQLQHRPFLHFGHNYNYVSRAAMYEWLNQHLDLKLPSPIVEEDYQLLSAEQLTVWNEEHPAPQGGPAFERRMLQWWADDATSQLVEATPEDEASVSRFRAIVGGAYEAILGRGVPQSDELEFDEFLKDREGGVVRIGGLLRNDRYNESLPILFLVPQEWQQGRVAIWLDEKGKQGLYDGDKLRSEVQRLVDAGVAVVGVDLLFQGEFLEEGQPIEQTRRVANPREAAAYTLGYNDSLFVRRVHDVLNLIGYVSDHEKLPSEVWLVGLHGMGPLAAAVRAQAAGSVDRAVIDTQGFRFQQVSDIRHPMLLPGGAKYFDLPGLIALAAPHETWVGGEDEIGVFIAQQMYGAVGVPDALTVSDASQDAVSQKSLNWLLSD